MDVGAAVFGWMRRSAGRDPHFRRASGVCAAMSVVLLLAFDATGDASAADVAEVAGIPQSVLQSKIPLRARLGRVHHPVSTGSAAAQDFYDQGLTYYYTFGWLEAARSFNAALAQDPQLAMAWLGLARSYDTLGRYQPDGNEAGVAAPVRETLRKAKALRGTIRSPNELALFDLVAERVDKGPFYRLDDDAKAEYRRKIADAVSAHPRDAELLLLQAMNAPEDSTGDRLDDVLAIAPDHVGAHHHLVHHYEMVEGKVDLAVAHGNLLARLAPQIAHARHMYGHNLGRVGRMADALAEFEAADAIELALARDEGVAVEYDWHHQHNLIYLLRSSYHERDLRRVDEIIPRLRRQATSKPGEPAWGLLPVIEYHVARDDWDGAQPHIDALADTNDDVARQAAALFRGLRQISGDEATEPSASAGPAKRKQGQGEAAPAEEIRFYTDLHAALLSVAAGDQARLEALVDETADDSGPYTWNDAHLRLDMIAALLIRMDRASLVEKVVATLQKHDPHYVGVAEWRARIADAGHAGPGADRD